MMTPTASAADIATDRDGTKSSGRSLGETGVGFTDQFYNVLVGTGEISPSQSPTSKDSAPPKPQEARVANSIEASLRERARLIIESIDETDEVEVQIYLTALRGIVAAMWESAVDCSETHQDVLASLEQGVRQGAVAGQVSRDQVSAFREALTYLAETSLVKKHAEVIRHEFLQVGFTALGFVNEPNTGENIQ